MSNYPESSDDELPLNERAERNEERKKQKQQMEPPAYPDQGAAPVTPGLASVELDAPAPIPNSPVAPSPFSSSGMAMGLPPPGATRDAALTHAAQIIQGGLARDLRVPIADMPQQLIAEVVRARIQGWDDHGRWAAFLQKAYGLISQVIQDQALARQLQAEEDAAIVPPDQPAAQATPQPPGAPSSSSAPPPTSAPHDTASSAVTNSDPAQVAGDEDDEPGVPPFFRWAHLIDAGGSVPRTVPTPSHTDVDVEAWWHAFAYDPDWRLVPILPRHPTPILANYTPPIGAPALVEYTPPVGAPERTPYALPQVQVIERIRYLRWLIGGIYFAGNDPATNCRLNPPRQDTSAKEFRTLVRQMHSVIAKLRSFSPGVGTRLAVDDSNRITLVCLHQNYRQYLGQLLSALRLSLTPGSLTGDTYSAIWER